MAWKTDGRQHWVTESLRDFCSFLYIQHNLFSVQFQAHKASEGEVKSANLAIIGQLKQFSLDCAGAVRADPKNKLLTRDLRCEEEVRAKLTNDRLLQEKVEAAMLQAGLVLSQVGLVSVSKQLLVTMSLKQQRGWKRRYNHQLLPLGPGDVRKANQKDVQKRRAGCSDWSSYGQVLQRRVLILEAWCIRDCDCKRWSGANAISIRGLKVGSVDQCYWVCRSIQRKPGGQNLQNVKEWHCWDSVTVSRVALIDC